MARSITILTALLLLGAPPRAHAQTARGAERLHALVTGLTVTPRVLLIGARPPDADEDLIAWLAVGHHVQTGFLALTRGESAPNFTGLESGATLGAIHLQEALAARSIDGGEQYFTRAYDFGTSRSATEAFRSWDHTTLLGDAVAVVRAFRPQVIIARFRNDTIDADGQRQASAIIAREVFDAARDTVRFPQAAFGMPWSPSALYEPGEGVTIDSRDFDRVIGRTYANLATESRAQLRSFGFAAPPWLSSRNMQWRRIAARSVDSLSGTAATSIFAGIDTSFMRLNRSLPVEAIRGGVPRMLVTQVPAMLAYADSARAALDLEHPSSVAPYLEHVVELASAARVLLRSCYHPARDAAASLSNTKCRPEWLDLDASLDLVLRRATDALLLASGIAFDITSDREFLASGDTAQITIAVTNNGDADATINDVAVTNSVRIFMTSAIAVPAHSTVSISRAITSIAYAHPWWIWKREQNFFPASTTALDGVPRPAIFMRDFGISGVAVPENIRRLGDVAVTLTVHRTTVTASIGDAVFRTADPVLGLMNRPTSGVPAVALNFERPLEWAQAGRPMKKSIRATVRSFSDKPQKFALRQAPPVGALRMDSLPASITLAPHEAREVTIPLRGKPSAMRYDLGLLGVAGADTFEVGFRTAQYSYLRPIHLFRASSLGVQSITIELPERLSVAYVRGAGEDTDVSLKQLGIPVYTMNNEGLTRFDLDAVSTIVIGPEAFRVDRNLLTQIPRLMEFARKGGTVVVHSNEDAVRDGGLLPFPASYAQPRAEQVTREDAPAMATGAARVLAWPNTIGPDDWERWMGPRALVVPTTTDPRYTRPVEIHDPEQRDNRNSILIAAVGKGQFVYSSLTLTQQIANGVPGAMRLLVNLMSAGLPATAGNPRQ